MLSEEGPGALTWVADIPLLTNPVILRAMALVMGLSYLLITVVFTIVLAADDHLRRLPSFMLAMLFGLGVVAVLLVLVMLIVFRNRMRCRFTIDDDGITSIVVDRKAEIAGSLAVVAGAASGDETLAGAGLGAVWSRREYTGWNRVSGAEYFPGRHFIRLKAAGWWPVGTIFCTAESYPAVAEMVRDNLDKKGC